MIFTDSHVHLHFEDFKGDVSSVLTRAREKGVLHLVNVGTNLACSQEAVRFAEGHEHVYAAVGCHPHDAKDFKDEDLEEYRKLTKHPKVVAIGEVGLDFYRNLSPREVQEGVFKKFLALQRETGLPLVLHVREAHEEVFRLLAGELGSTVAGLLHCFSGSPPVLEKALALDLWVSFAGNVTYKKNTGLREIVRSVPRHKILIETDSPFLPPEGYRGERNEPSYLVETAARVAQELEVSLEDLGRLTTENAAVFFRIPAANQRSLS